MAFKSGLPPKEQPTPIAVQYGTPEDATIWKRLLFVKYLVKTQRLGRGDLKADPR